MLEPRVVDKVQPSVECLHIVVKTSQILDGITSGEVAFVIVSMIAVLLSAMIVGQHVVEGVEGHLVGAIFVCLDGSQIACAVIVEGHDLSDAERQVGIEGDSSLLPVVRQMLPVGLPVANEIIRCSFGILHWFCCKDEDTADVSGLAHKRLKIRLALEIVAFTFAIIDVEHCAGNYTVDVIIIFAFVLHSAYSGTRTHNE